MTAVPAGAYMFAAKAASSNFRWVVSAPAHGRRAPVPPVAQPPGAAAEVWSTSGAPLPARSAPPVLALGGAAPTAADCSLLRLAHALRRTQRRADVQICRHATLWTLNRSLTGVRRRHCSRALRPRNTDCSHGGAGCAENVQELLAAGGWAAGEAQHLRCVVD